MLLCVDIVVGLLRMYTIGIASYIDTFLQYATRSRRLHCVQLRR